MKDLFKLEEYIVSKLDEMQKEKAVQMSNIEPNFVTNGELFSGIDKDVRAVLNKLYREKRIRIHETVHAKCKNYVELVDRFKG